MAERIASQSTARFGYQQMNLQSRPQAFTFDRYGNRTAFSQNIAGNTEATNLTIDAATNRFISGQGFGYDKNGNVIADIDPLSSLTRQFVYDGENKQTAVRDQSQNVIGQYFYDGDGVPDTVIPPSRVVTNPQTADMRAPVATVTWGRRIQTQRVTINVTDSGSGVCRFFYRAINSGGPGSWNEITGDYFTGTLPGAFLVGIEVVTEDNAGNRSDVVFYQRPNE